MNYRKSYLVILLISCLQGVAQIPMPVAKFSFNNKDVFDQVSGTASKFVGVNFTYDRFENKNHAVYFYGNSASYVNLGNYKALKQKIGTISLWVNIDGEIWSGTGRDMNPVIITKNCKGSNFNEAYYMCYFPDMNKVGAFCTQDSLNQVLITGTENFELMKWHHLVMTYDNRYLSFYIDGKLENKLPKPFETKFLGTDSVMLGVTASKKNNRFLQGAIDDVEFYDRVLSNSDVEKLYNAPNPNRAKIILNWVLVIFMILFITAGIYFYIKRRLGLAMKKEKEKLKLYNTILETELRVNRALMNPHFVFNSLNALHNFILAKENDNASDYLIKFSKLIRKILEGNMNDVIRLDMEIELISGYLEIETLRFERNIIFTVTSNIPVAPSAIYIPIMMIQPFVENAIWHGLLDKPGEKKIDISFSFFEEKYILCCIEDNGIGREKSEQAENAKKSMATNFVRQRLTLLNNIHDLHCRLDIEDKAGKAGTIVTIILPILNK